MLQKQKGHFPKRFSYTAHSSVNCYAGQVAFLSSENGVTVVTTAASGATRPIGTFWKDRSTSYIRRTIENGTFDSNDQILLKKGNVTSTGNMKITNLSGGTTYALTTDYTVTTANGVITRTGGGNIATGETVVIWYEYSLTGSDITWQNVASRDTRGQTYDRVNDASLGSGKIAVIQGSGDVWFYTDQFDLDQVYGLNDQLYSDATSMWTNHVASAVTGVIGQVIAVPTASSPWLGVMQMIG